MSLCSSCRGWGGLRTRLTGSAGFARQYRVVGITRRGWGRSSPSPRYEYGSTVLLRDILTVMDSSGSAPPTWRDDLWPPRSDAARRHSTPSGTEPISSTRHRQSLSAGTSPGRIHSPRRKGRVQRPPGRPTEMIARDDALGGREPVSELCATSHFGPDGGRYMGLFPPRTQWEAIPSSARCVSPTPLSPSRCLPSWRPCVMSEIVPRHRPMMNSADSARADRPRRVGAQCELDAARTSLAECGPG